MNECLNREYKLSTIIREILKLLSKCKHLLRLSKVCTDISM